MKRWEAAEIKCLDISETAHKLSLDFVPDGGYIGDGKISGWFGGSEKKDDDKPTPGPTPDPVDFTS